MSEEAKCILFGGLIGAIMASLFWFLGLAIYFHELEKSDCVEKRGGRYVQELGCVDKNLFR